MAELLTVSNVLDGLELKDSMMGAEFGCGSAIFSLSLAKKLRKGRVYALDVQEQKLSAIKGRAAIEGVTNVIPVLCDLERENGSTLHAGSMDIVLIPNLLFQVENKRAIITEASRVLKLGGGVLVIDWAGPGPGSPKSELVGRELVKEMAKESGLMLKKEFMVGDYHYALLFVK